MKQSVSKYLSEIGRRGGKKSRRVLTSEQAKAMAQAKKDKHARNNPKTDNKTTLIL